MLPQKQKVNVSSLPLKDVIKDLALAFEVQMFEQCSEYFIHIPKEVGEGEIRGLNFDNGLGLIIYNCVFREDFEIHFTVDDIHPLKYLYTVNGPIEHEFANVNETHVLVKHKCAMVASQEHNGHILRFKANELSYLISLEIDRSKFANSLSCELEDLSDTMKSLLTDNIASRTFYHEGYYGVSFLNLFNSINDFKDKKMVRKLFLESKSLDIFVNQIELFDDDFKTDNNKRIFRTNEIDIIENASTYVLANIQTDFKVKELANHFGLNENKLQEGFKYFHNMTVREFIIQNRLIEASKLIRKTNLSISQIAENVGFSNKSHFSKSFKNLFKVSPKKFRN